MTVEERLTAAFRAADQYQPSPDLFAKVARSIEEDAAHRRRVRRVVTWIAAALGVIAGYLYVVVDRVDGAFRMPFWSLETLVTGVMVAVVWMVGPAIRRFGTAFEGDVFGANFSTGRSFLTLMDFAYYLIFGAYTFMTLQYSPPANVYRSDELVTWLRFGTQRVAGLLMLMGLLHAVTLMVLPVVGLVFSANTRRARRRDLGEGVLPANPGNEKVDRWISIAVWTLVGFGLLLILGMVVIPVLVGLAT